MKTNKCYDSSAKDLIFMHSHIPYRQDSILLLAKMKMKQNQSRLLITFTITSVGQQFTKTKRIITMRSLRKKKVKQSISSTMFHNNYHEKKEKMMKSQISPYSEEYANSEFR